MSFKSASLPYWGLGQIRIILTSFTIALFSKLQNFLKYFRNWHFFSKIFENFVKFRKYIRNICKFRKYFRKFCNFEKNVNGRWSHYKKRIRSTRVFWASRQTKIVFWNPTDGVVSASSLVLQMKCSTAVERKSAICWIS